ncbi:MAG TPA: pseudouridine synthase, partial [Luteimonas sp.]|nr:pseudouridine synthase [Luteimonas sp.]
MSSSLVVDVRASAPRHGLARVLSKQGLCSRSEAARWIADGRVRVDGRIQRDPEYPIIAGRHRILVDGHEIAGTQRVCLMLNKPRGLVTTTRDEQGRDTVYRCLGDAGLPWLAPVGRLDKASEGLLLFTNDPAWAAGITDPQRGPGKTYHVQVDCIPDAPLLSRLEGGVPVDGEQLRATHVRLLRSGSRNAWLEIELDEGRNRQI